MSTAEVGSPGGKSKRRQSAPAAQETAAALRKIAVRAISGRPFLVILVIFVVKKIALQSGVGLLLRSKRRPPHSERSPCRAIGVDPCASVSIRGESVSPFPRSPFFPRYTASPSQPFTRGTPYLFQPLASGLRGPLPRIFHRRYSGQSPISRIAGRHDVSLSATSD